MTSAQEATHITSARTHTRDLKTIVRGAGINFVGSVSSLLLTFCFQWLLARALGPAAVGIIGLASTVITLAAILSVFGLQTGVLRFVALYFGQGDRARASGVVVTGVCIVGILSLVAATVLFGAADWLATGVFGKPLVTPVLRVLAISLPFMAMTWLLLSVTQGLKRMEFRVTIEEVIVPLLKIGGVIAIVYAIGRSAVGVAYVLLGASIVGAVLAAISVWWLYPLRGRRERPILVTRTMLSFSWPLLLLMIVHRAWKETEMLVLGIFTASDQVGIYYMGLRTTVVITLFLTSFSTIFAPIMAELHGLHDYERLSSLLKTVTKWGFSLSLPIFLLLFAFSEEVMLVFGPEFVAGAMVLRLLAISELFNVATGPVGWLLTMSGHPRFNLLNTILLLGLNLVLALFLIPRYGIVGAAASGALGTLIVNLLRLLEVYVILRVHPYNLSYLKPIAAGLLSVLPVFGLNLLLPGLPTLGRVVISTLVLLPTYVVGLFVLRLSEEDRVVLGALWRRLGRFVPRKAASG
ncbi:MAG: flippase [Promethearchaeota archaeon]